MMSEQISAGAAEEDRSNRAVIDGFLYHTANVLSFSRPICTLRGNHLWRLTAFLSRTPSPSEPLSHPIDLVRVATLDLNEFFLDLRRQRMSEVTVAQVKHSITEFYRFLTTRKLIDTDPTAEQAFAPPDDLNRLKLPQGYEWPSDIVAKLSPKFPQLCMRVITAWYQVCCPLYNERQTEAYAAGTDLTDTAKGLSVWPPEATGKVNFRRAIRTSEINCALRWYRDDLPERFDDPKLGELVWRPEAAKELGVDVTALKYWIDSGCPRLGTDPKDSIKNKKLSSYTFYQWGKRGSQHGNADLGRADEAFGRSRDYVRKIDVNRIKNFSPAPEMGLSMSDMEKTLGSRAYRFFETEGRSKKHRAITHATLTDAHGRPRAGRASITLVEQVTKRGYTRIRRRPMVNEADVETILRGPDKQFWLKIEDLLGSYPPPVSHDLDAAHQRRAARHLLFRAIKAARVSAKPLFGASARGRLYSVPEWKLEVERVKMRSRTGIVAHVPDLQQSRMLATIDGKLSTLHDKHDGLHGKVDAVVATTGEIKVKVASPTIPPRPRKPKRIGDNFPRRSYDTTAMTSALIKNPAGQSRALELDNCEAWHRPYIAE
jgi:hypothetical protein